MIDNKINLFTFQKYNFKNCVYINEILKLFGKLLILLELIVFVRFFY